MTRFVSQFKFKLNKNVSVVMALIYVLLSGYFVIQHEYFNGDFEYYFFTSTLFETFSDKFDISFSKAWYGSVNKIIFPVSFWFITISFFLLNSLLKKSSLNFINFLHTFRYGLIFHFYLLLSTYSTEIVPGYSIMPGNIPLGEVIHWYRPFFVGTLFTLYYLFCFKTAKDFNKGNGEWFKWTIIFSPLVHVYLFPSFIHFYSFSIALIIILGFSLDGGSFENLTPFFSERPMSSLVGPLGLAMVAVLWTFDGWIFVSYVAGEIKEPDRNIPLSLIFCMLIVVSIYLSLNFVLVYALGFDRMVGSELVMSDAASVFLGGAGGTIISLVIIISLLGANNSFILSSARINFAMAQDKLFFKKAAVIHPKYDSPANALWMQCAWACLLTFTGTFDQLITYVIFASWVFYGMSAGAVIILRKKRPDIERPYKTPFYPWVPIIFVLFSIFLTI